MRTNLTKRSTIPGPDSIANYQLQNGAEILVFENNNAQSIYMIGILGGGGNQDPAGKTGLAHFTASLLSRGTLNIPFNKFHYLLESAGANLTFSCGSRHAWFRGKALAEDAELLFHLASEGLRHPVFRKEYIERMRGQLLTGLALRDQDTGEMASLLFDQHLFKGHPFGKPVDGYPDSVQSITKAEIVDFHNTYYSPEKMTIVISGAVNSDEIHRLAEKYFSSWEKPKSLPLQEPPLPNPPGKIVRKHHFLAGKSQVDLIIGGYGPSRTSDDYLPAFIGNNILGQFGMMGRIGKSVRVESGLAYYASSSISARIDTGTWNISAGVNPENVRRVIDLIRKEIGIFINNKVTHEELVNSKSHLIGRRPMSMETNAGLANAILVMHRFKLGFDYYRKYKDLISAVNADQIRLTAGKYLHPDLLIITSSGSGKEIG